MASSAAMEMRTPVFKRMPMYSWWVLVVTVFCYACFFVTLNIPGVFSTVISQEWGISTTQLSMITTASMITFAFMPLLSDRFTRDWNIKQIVAVGLACNIASSALTPIFGTTYEGLIVLRLLQGCTGGIMQGALGVQLSLWFPSKLRGFATGVQMGFLCGGMAICSFLSVPLYDMGLSWQMVNMVLGVIPSTVGVIAYGLTIKDFRKTYPDAQSMDDLLPKKDEEKISRRFDSLPKAENTKQIWTSSRFWAAGIYAAITAIFVYGLSYAIPLYLQLDKGFTLAAASSASATAMVFGIVGSPLGGIISDRIFGGVRLQVNMFSLPVAGVLILCLPLVPSAMIVPYMCAIYLIGYLWGGGFFSWALSLAAPRAQNSAGNFFTVVSNIGSILSTPLIGLFVDNVSVIAALVMVGVFCVASIVAARKAKI